MKIKNLFKTLTGESMQIKDNNKKANESDTLFNRKVKGNKFDSNEHKQTFKAIPDDDYPSYEECCAKYKSVRKSNSVIYSNDGKILEEVELDFEGPLIIPEGVKTLRECNSSDITAIIMPDSVTKIEEYFDCSNIASLEYVRLSRGLTEIPQGIFQFSDVSEWHFPEGLKVIGADNFESSTLNKGCTRVKFPSTLEYILSNTFEDNSFEEIVIPASVKVIFPGAFSGNDKLRKVKFMSDETVVLEGAFDCCDFINSEAIWEAHKLGDRVFGADKVMYEGKTLTYIPPYYCGKLVVKNGTEKIASNIDFNRLKGITELYLPDSLDYNDKYLKNIKVLRTSNKK